MSSLTFQILKIYAGAFHASFMETKEWGIVESQFCSCCGGLFWGLVWVQLTDSFWSLAVLTSTTPDTMKALLLEMLWLTDWWRSVQDQLAGPTIKGFPPSLEHSGLFFWAWLETTHFRPKFVEVWEAISEKIFALGAMPISPTFHLKILLQQRHGGEQFFSQLRGSPARHLPFCRGMPIHLLSSGIWCIWCHMAVPATSAHLSSVCCVDLLACLNLCLALLSERTDAWSLLTRC